MNNDLDKLCMLCATLGAHPWVLKYQQYRRMIHGWMFGTGTRAIELLNAAALLAWAITLLDDRLLVISIYIGSSIWSHHWANEALSALFALAGIFALAGLLRRDKASDKLASMGLQLGALLWGGASLNFLATYPPVNTGVVVYSLLAVITWSAGCYLSDD